MGYLIVILMALLGLGVGVGAGLYLAPPAETAECDPAAVEECAPDTGEATATPVVPEPEPGAPPPPAPGELFDYVRLNNQFVIPVIDGDTVAALVVISLSIEVVAGTNAAVFDREPRLRDAFLQVFFDFAHSGGFDGPFTQSSNLATLRRALRETGQRIVGPEVRDVLIVDIVRQEV
jgi:hypothetical protein